MLDAPIWKICNEFFASRMRSLGRKEQRIREKDSVTVKQRS
jgi:hypothetical protein